MRIIRTQHRYAPEGADMIDFYDKLPEEEFLVAQEVSLTLGEGDYPGPPVKVVVCDKCGEEVMDNRHVAWDGKCLCKSCAQGAYYQVQQV